MKNIIIATTICILTSLTLFGQTNKRTYKKFTDTDFKIGDIILGPDIWFSLSGGCQIMPQSKDSLKIIVDFIQKHPSYKIEIGSHTDNRGKKESNLKLSELRAKSIVDYLTKELLLPSDNFEAKGYGSTQLVIGDAQIKKVSDKTEKEKLHQKNRRVEIKILRT